MKKNKLAIVSWKLKICQKRGANLAKERIQTESARDGVSASRSSPSEDQPPRKRSKRTSVLEDHHNQQNQNNSQFSSPTSSSSSRFESSTSSYNNHTNQLLPVAERHFSILEMLEENMNGSNSSSAYDMNGHRIVPAGTHEQSSAVGAATNGTAATNGVSHHVNSNHDLQPIERVALDKANRDIVRLIGQHLKLIGLDRTAHMLMQESGCSLEHPAATKFRDHVLNGDWQKADYDLQELQSIVDDDMKLSSKHTNLIEMKFLLLEQKYLEYLDDSRPIDALHVLRNELTPLQHNTPRVHQLSSYMMCTNNEELYERAAWEGKNIRSRTRLMDRLQSFLPASVMLPPRRLHTLLRQAVELQTEHCTHHDMAWETSIDNVSLLSDHNCSSIANAFPVHPLQVLNGHSDEVMYCKFSPNGLRLATGSKDSFCIIWDVDPERHHLKHVKSLECHNNGVTFVTWSPDSKFLIVCGSEESSELLIFNMEELKLHSKVSHSNEESLTCAAFAPDGKRFVTGGLRGQFYLCDLDGTLLGHFDGVRVNALAFLGDNQTILAADTHYRIRNYCFDTHNECNMIAENNPIMTFTVNSTDRLALLNVASQGLHLWDLRDKCLIRIFQGNTQGSYSIYACFGGVNEGFIASGSEDNNVYIWHIRREEPLYTLSGHTRTVNCVSWNPVYPSMIASCSDDGTVRIWGPKQPISSGNGSLSGSAAESRSSSSGTTPATSSSSSLNHHNLNDDHMGSSTNEMANWNIS